MTFPIAIALIATLDTALIALLAFAMALPRRLAPHHDRAAAQLLELHPPASVGVAQPERCPAAA